MNFTKEQYANMDYIVNITYINIFTKNKNNSRVYLSEVDFKNPEHLFFVSVVYTYAQIMGMDIDIVYPNRWQLFWWNFKNRKIHPKIRVAHKEDYIFGNVYLLKPKEFLDFERGALEEKLGKDCNFGIIYEEYFKKGK